jgi:hypothetical protein
MNSLIEVNETVVIATGDRGWEDIETVYNAVSKFPPNTVFVHGYANGADCTVDVVADHLGFRVIKCPAHWNCRYHRWIEVYGDCDNTCIRVCGRPAGALRNRHMLNTFLPWLVEVIGFHNNIMDSKGTKDMMKLAQKAGIKNTLYLSDGTVFESPQLTKKRESSKLKKIPPPKRFFQWD